MNARNILQKLFLVTTCTICSISYAGSNDPQWDYFGQTVGQSTWSALPSLDPLAPIPELYPYAECGLGQKQSPIDISTTSANKISQINGIKFKYKKTPLFVNDNGHAIVVNMPPLEDNKNKFYVGKQKYHLSQLVFHSPSEHKTDNQSSKMEIQFIHTTPSGKLAVVSVLVNQNTKNKNNSEIQKILDLAYGKAPSNYKINLSKLLPGKKNKFYTYAGSLTTPPCTEGVDWYVLRYPLKISADQITQFQDLYLNNIRLTQNLENRIVEKNFK